MDRTGGAGGISRPPFVLLGMGKEIETVNALRLRGIGSGLTSLTLVLAFLIISPASADAGALAEARERGSLIACVDPYNPPFSSNNPGSPGFDVEIANTIGQSLGFRITYFWADTGTRGGLGRALRTSIQQKKCDFFMGISAGQEMEEEVKERGLELTKPYFSTGFVLFSREEMSDVRSLQELKRKKIGVEMSTPADGYLFYKSYNRALFRNGGEALEAMQKGEIPPPPVSTWMPSSPPSGSMAPSPAPDVALLWAPSAGWWVKLHPDSGLKLVKGYTPEPEMRWNIAIAVRKGDRDLKEAIDQAIDRLVKSGQIREILAKYGVPFYAPFD